MIKLLNLFTNCFKKKKRSNQIEITSPNHINNSISILDTNFKPCEVFFIDYDQISDITIK